MWVRDYESLLGEGIAGHLASPIGNLVSRARSPIPSAFHSPLTSLLCHVITDIKEIFVRFGAAPDKASQIWRSHPIELRVGT